MAKVFRGEALFHGAGVLAAFGAGLAVPALAAQDPQILQPSSPWAINYAEDSCHLARTFGQGDQQVTIELRQFGPSDGFTLLGAGKSLKFSGRGKALVTEFEPRGRRHEDGGVVISLLDDGRSLVQTQTALLPRADDPVRGKRAQRHDWHAEGEPLTPPDRAAEAKITRLHLAGPIRQEVVVELGPMDKPMDAMRACVDELITHWGIDAAANRGLTRRAAPRTDPQTWLTSDDYPTQMVREAKSDIVNFRIMVDAAGSPTGCVVQTPSGTEFDRVTCEVLERHARFTPALDASGTPVASFYINSVRWLAAR
jgi:hypothetical protein